MILLYVAMFIHHSLVDIGIFMALSLLSLLYLGHTLPYKSKLENLLLIFNEIMTLTVCYFLLEINGAYYDGE